MKGFPKHLNAKQDYLNVLSMYPDETKLALQALLDSRFVWVDSDIVDGKIEDDTHKILEKPDDAGTIQQYQMELVEDVNAHIFRLGFTVKEVEFLKLGDK